MQEVIELCWLRRQEIGRFHRKYLTPATQSKKLCATLHLQCSTCSIRWWRIGTCILYKYKEVIDWPKERKMLVGIRNATTNVWPTAINGNGGTGSDTSASADYSGNGRWRERKCYHSRGGVFCGVHKGSYLVLSRGIDGLFRAESVCSTSTKREFSSSGVRIALPNNNNQVVSPPATAPPLITDVAVEDVVDESASGSGAELSTARRHA